MVWQVTVTRMPSRQDKAVLQTVFSQSAVELYVLDDQLRVVRMSPAAHGLQVQQRQTPAGRYFTRGVRL